MNSKLWFVNNPRLVYLILAFLAKYQENRGVLLYAFVMMGNHFHLIASFPRANKAAFMRDLNSMIAKLVASGVEVFEGGKLWGRRYSDQTLVLESDVEHWFFYVALNPVSSGLMQKLSEYPSYNSFSDAVKGIERKHQLVDWTDYHNRKRYNPKLTIQDCTKTYTLRFSRLPGYEGMSDEEYRKIMFEKLEKRRQAVVKERFEEGKGFAGKEVLRATKPGEAPKSTKKRGARPILLSLCMEAKRLFLDWYLDIYAKYLLASKKYLSGEAFVEFPERTYKPPLFMVPRGMPG